MWSWEACMAQSRELAPTPKSGSGLVVIQYPISAEYRISYLIVKTSTSNRIEKVRFHPPQCGWEPYLSIVRVHTCIWMLSGLKDKALMITPFPDLTTLCQGHTHQLLQVLIPGTWICTYASSKSLVNHPLGEVTTSDSILPALIGSAYPLHGQADRWPLIDTCYLHVDMCSSYLLIWINNYICTDCRWSSNRYKIYIRGAHNMIKLVRLMITYVHTRVYYLLMYILK